MMIHGILLFDLPPELVSNILVHAVLARGVKRALRLRLVCSMLYKLLSWTLQILCN